MKDKDCCPPLQSLLTPEQVADYLGVTKRTLANWRCVGFPNIPWSKVGSRVRYQRSDLQAYLAQHTFNTVKS